MPPRQSRPALVTLRPRPPAEPVPPGWRGPARRDATGAVHGAGREHLVEVELRRSNPAVEPPGTRWIFPSAPPGALRGPGEGAAPGGQSFDGGPGDSGGGPGASGAGLEQGRPDEVVGVGADLEPGTLLAAYRSGVFPMPVSDGLVAWWSPEPRGVIPLDGLRMSRSLRRSCSRYTIRIDTAFDEVIEACGDRRRRGGWIDADVKAAYTRLHHWGWVHSVEAWDPFNRLAGGLYGVAIGGLFAGESMFHRQSDASKVALVALVEQLRDAGASLLDVQWATPHLKSLGAVEVSRREYLDRLATALAQRQPDVFGG